MKLTTFPLLRWVRAHPRWVLAGTGVLIVAGALLLRSNRTEGSSAVYTAKRGDFLISVVEGGTLQAVNEIQVRNEVEGTARIIYIVPEGSYVKKGDLLVELDSAAAQDQYNQQMINVEKAQFAEIQAKEQFEIQKSIVESEIRAADLKLEFALTDLKKYLEGEAVQERRKAESDIANIREKLAIDDDRLKWSEKLHQQGFETKSNLDRDKLTLMQSQLSLETATNTLWMLEKFDFPKKRRQFESAVEEAKKELERVKHQGTSRLAQYEADVRTQEITHKLSRDKLDRDRRQVDSAKIYAPQDGLVVYAISDNRFSSESLIEEGATVRNRQTLIKLPDVSEMKLAVKIHESHINMIRTGLPAFVVLDSMPDRRFRGVVSKVGLLPDTQSRFGNPNLKVYATEVLLRDRLPEDVKPGVSARAEVVVTNLEDVISVPIQAVTTRRGRPVIYLAQGDASKAVAVEVGLYNTKFIEITSGLSEGDRVLLSPPFDTQEKDLGGAILADGEKSAVTNLLALAPPPNAAANGGAPAEQPERRGPDRAGAGQRNGPAGLDPSGTPGDRGDRPIRQGAEPGGPPGLAGGGNRPNFDELRKQYDKNGDGELDEEEREAMRAAMRERFGQAGARPRRDPAAGELSPGAGGQSGDVQSGNRSERSRGRRGEPDLAPGSTEAPPARPAERRGNRRDDSQ